MWMGSCVPPFAFLKSTMISFVLEVLRSRLLSEHHVARCRTSSLYAVSSLLLMRPITVVSSANLMKELDPFTGLQSSLKRE